MIYNIIMLQCNKCLFTPFNSTCTCNNVAVNYSDNFRVIKVYVDDISDITYVHAIVKDGKVSRILFDEILQEDFVDNYYLLQNDKYYRHKPNRLSITRPASGVTTGNLFKHQYRWSTNI